MESAIHIGIADWCEISHVHGKKYQRVLGVEAIRKSAETAKTRANHYNRQHGTDYQVLNYLITNEDDRIYEYNIASNHGHSSSIYKMKEHKEVWEDVKEVEVHKLKSKRFATIINFCVHAIFLTPYSYCCILLLLYPLSMFLNHLVFYHTNPHCVPGEDKREKYLFDI